MPARHLRPLRRRSQREPREVGSGSVGTAFGAVVFVAFLALAAHTLVGLYATSVLTAVSWDLARGVATARDPAAARAAAESDASRRLGAFAELQLTWSSSIEATELTVRARRPSLLPPALLRSVGSEHIERTLVVRREIER